MSKMREKESLECVTMHIWALKTQKLPGPLSGPWTPAADCLLRSRDSASLRRQLSASEAGAPPWPNPGSAPVKSYSCKINRLTVARVKCPQWSTEELQYCSDVRVWQSVCQECVCIDMKNVAGDGYKYLQRTAENAFQIIRSRQRKYISLRAKEIDLVFRIAEKSCKADPNVILLW